MRRHRTRTIGRWTPLAAAVTAAALPGLFALTGCGSYATDWVEPKTTPYIVVELSTSALSIAQGTRGAVTVFLSRRSGYTGAVALTLNGAPEGVSSTFDPPVFDTDARISTLTLLVGGSTAPDTYSITITASGPGVASQPTVFALTVTPSVVPAIELSLASGTMSLTQGESGTVYLYVTRRGGFSGAASLALTGAPTGVSWSFDPVLVGSTTHGSTVSVMAAATTEPGTYPLTITGTGADVASHSTTLILSVAKPPAPAITIRSDGDDGLLWTVQGDGWEWPVDISRIGGFAGVVSLSIEGLPQGVTAEFDPPSLNPGSTRSMLMLIAERNAPPTVTNVTLRARGAGVADATAVVRFAVFPPA